ncbi:MAG: lysylphosphatidylglycerol synthase transmembrane domain-containing protein [Pseudomonadota bacterium]
MKIESANARDEALNQDPMGSAALPTDPNSGPDALGIRMDKIVRSVLVFLIAGTVLYAAVTIGSGYESTVNALEGFSGRTLLLVLALVVVGWILRGLRFLYYLKVIGDPVPAAYGLAVFIASFALTGTPGKMGEAAKGFFLKRDYGIPMTRVIGVLVVERLMDLWGVLVLCSFSFLLFDRWRSLFLICAAVTVAGGACLCMESLYRPLLERMSKIRVLSWVSDKALGILLTGRDLMTPRIFAVGLVLSVVAWGLEAVCFYLILQGLGLSATLLQANFAYSFSTLIGALSMLPGGIGGAEAGMLGLLAIMGISYSSALPAVLLIRVCTLWFAVAVGAVLTAWLLLRSRERR